LVSTDSFLEALELRKIAVQAMGHAGPRAYIPADLIKELRGGQAGMGKVDVKVELKLCHVSDIN
jgi:hypothetical protein